MENMDFWVLPPISYIEAALVLGSAQTGGAIAMTSNSYNVHMGVRLLF